MLHFLFILGLTSCDPWPGAANVGVCRSAEASASALNRHLTALKPGGLTRKLPQHHGGYEDGHLDYPFMAGKQNKSRKMLGMKVFAQCLYTPLRPPFRSCEPNLYTIYQQPVSGYIFKTATGNHPCPRPSQGGGCASKEIQPSSGVTGHRHPKASPFRLVNGMSTMFCRHFLESPLKCADFISYQ